MYLTSKSEIFELKESEKPIYWAYFIYIQNVSSASLKVTDTFLRSNRMVGIPWKCTSLFSEYCRCNWLTFLWFLNNSVHISWHSQRKCMWSSCKFENYTFSRPRLELSCIVNVVTFLETICSNPMLLLM